MLTDEQIKAIEQRCDEARKGWGTELAIHARQDIPALLADRRELVAEVGRLRADADGLRERLLSLAHAAPSAAGVETENVEVAMRALVNYAWATVRGGDEGDVT